MKKNASVTAAQYSLELFPGFSTPQANTVGTLYADLGSQQFQVNAVQGECDFTRYFLIKHRTDYNSAIFICPTYYLLNAFPGRSFKVDFLTQFAWRRSNNFNCRESSRSHQDSTEGMSHITSLRIRLSTIRNSSMLLRSHSPPSSSISTQTSRLIRPRLHPTGISLISKIQKCSSIRHLRGNQSFGRYKLRTPLCSAVGMYPLMIIVYLL
jgi:hypothetical protein